jgi:SAM-dependent methyltransferase
MDILKCRVCGHGEAESLGRVPDCGEFAGQMIAPSLNGGQLWRCMDCGSMFRYPTLSANEYLALYEKASSDVWKTQVAQRKDFATIYAYLNSHIGGSILDIGCYAGNFLVGIPEKFKKFGLEPSKSASNSAISKGINILGRTLSDLDAKQVFDVVVAIDVIEHVLEVETFLMDALTHVNRNGLLIISTGNPDCFFWRSIFKARFWYSSYPEHVVFPSYKYFCEFAKLRGLPVPEQMRFKYGEFRFLAVFLGLLDQLIYTFSPAVYRAFIRLRRRMKGKDIPMAADIPLGAAGVFSDHQAIIFRQRG